jgi:hypothetical protein
MYRAFCAVVPTLQGLRKSASAEPFRIASLRALLLHITRAAPSAGRAKQNDASRHHPLHNHPRHRAHRPANYPMITAWQTSALENVPERLVKFGRGRRSVTITITEDASGIVVEARLDRRIVVRIACSREDVTTTVARAAEKAAFQIAA